MNEEANETTSGAATASSSSVRVFVLLGILIVFGVLAGMSLPARSNWKEAQEKAEAILGTDDDWKPVAFMKAIGKRPMVLDKPDGLTQVYRWTGGLRTYELTIKFSAPFSDKPGAYGPTEGVAATAKLRFSAGSLEGYTLANEATGSTYAKLAELKVDNSNVPAMSPPGPVRGSSGGSGRGSAQGLGKAGNRKGGGFGRSSGPPEELNLTDDQKTKWTAASTKQTDKMRELFTSGIPREKMAAKIADMRAGFKEDVKKFLTAEQLDKYKEIESQRPQRGSGDRGKRDGESVSKRPSGPGRGRPSKDN